MVLKDYIKKYGNQKLTASNFNEVDAAYFAMLSLLDINNVFPKKKQSLDINSLYKEHEFLHGTKKLGLLLPLEITKTLKLGSKTNRYKDLIVHDSLSIIDKEKEIQCNIFQIDIDNKNTLVIFGSTDNSIVGWKEDFAISYKKLIPSQINAIRYVNTKLKENHNYIFIGHSKGGLISLYCGLFSKLNSNLIGIYNFDGPGFNEEILKDININKLSKCHIFLPSESVVGRVYNQPTNFNIVESNTHGLMQHNLDTWLIDENKFIKTNSFKEISNIISNHLNNAIKTLSKSQIHKFSDDFFKILYGKEAISLYDILKHPLESELEFLKLSFESKTRFIAIISYLIDEKIIPSKIKKKYLL